MTEGERMVLDMARAHTDLNGTWSDYIGVRITARKLCRQGLLKDAGIAPFKDAALYVITPAGRRALEEGTGRNG